MVPERDERQAPAGSGVVPGHAVLAHVRNAVLELHEDVRAVVETQPITRTEILVDPHPHAAHQVIRLDRYLDLVQPPIAKRVPVQLDRPSGAVVDDWAWLAQRDDPDTISYLKAENDYTNEWFAPLDPLIEDIFQEIKRRTLETDLSVPVRKGAWWYLTRTVEGLAYPLRCRRANRDDTNTEIVMLDENNEAVGHEHFSLGALDVSPDGDLLAWSADYDGSEEYLLRFRDLATGKDLPDVVERIAHSVAWSLDRRHCFYLRLDDAMRPHQVWRHELGTPAADDVLVFEEPDERFHLGVDLTRSEAFIVISLSSRTTSEVHVIPSDDPTSAPRLVEPRRDDHEYSLDHRGDRFVIVTNLDAEDFRVVTAPITTPGVEHWTELVPHESGRRIHSADCFAEAVVLHEWAHGLPRLRLLFDDGSQRTLEFDEEVHGVEPVSNPAFDATSIRFEYESYVTPPTIIEEDLSTGARTILKQMPVLDGFDAKHYKAERTWAEAADGVRVPVDVVRAVSAGDGPLPIVLYGYGAYEVALPPWFSIARLSLLDRGVAFAVAHPRGGGELGRRWYLDGKLQHKRNTFTDFLASAEHLVRAGYAHGGRVAIRGGSAGGLLVGAAVTMAPAAVSAVVAEVPFVDVVTTMLDPSLPLTVIEWEEWGDPRDPAAEAYIRSYSPYDNVAAVRYPPLFVTAGLNDPRVSYHEPAKWVAKLRATADPSTLVLLRTEMDAGHGGATGRYDEWRDEARVLAFLLSVLDVA
jgi:oligopeptidase B